MWLQIGTCDVNSIFVTYEGSATNLGSYHEHKPSRHTSNFQGCNLIKFNHDRSKITEIIGACLWQWPADARIWCMGGVCVQEELVQGLVRGLCRPPAAGCGLRGWGGALSWVRCSVVHQTPVPLAFQHNLIRVICDGRSGAHSSCVPQCKHNRPVSQPCNF